MAITLEENDPDFTDIKRVLLACEWFRLYDVIEDLYGQLDFHDTKLRNEDEEFQSYPFQTRQTPVQRNNRVYETSGSEL